MASGTDPPRDTLTLLAAAIVQPRTGPARSTDAMRRAAERVHALVTQLGERGGGTDWRSHGSGRFLAFRTARDALAAALELRLALDAEDWRALGLSEPLEIGMALHTGGVEGGSGPDHASPVAHRLESLLAIAHGGQVLLSGVTERLVTDGLPEDIQLRDLGQHRLKDLMAPERVFQLMHPALSADFPPLASLERRANNLPIQLTSLIGRAEELERVAAMLTQEGDRLVTLTGPGGTGKTRLGVQVAAEVAGHFDDGVWFVSLAALMSPELVIPTIAEALGLRTTGSASIGDLLAEHLRERHTLLVLDNFEHLTDAATDVAGLLEAHGVSLLVTSRSPLRLRGEREVPIPPMQLPRRTPPPTTEQLSQYSAVQLFIERARAVRPSFTVTKENAPAVAEICYRLDGLPLAIELAAARIKLLSPEALLSRLEQRLPLLTGGARDLPKRQQTLRQTIQWSYDLLSPDEARVFRLLSVFAGGFTLELVESVWSRLATDEDAAANIAGSPLEQVAALVDESLVRQRELDDGETRFDLLLTIREFAGEMLDRVGEGHAVRRAHAAVLAELTVAALPELNGPNQAMWYRRLDLEHDNVRAALMWTIESGDAALATELAALLWKFWWVRGHQVEGGRWLQRVLAVPGSEGTISHARCLLGAAWLAESGGDYDTCAPLYEQALAAAREIGDSPLLGETLNAIGTFRRDLGDYETAKQLHREALGLFEAPGQERDLARTLYNIGAIHYFLGELEESDVYVTRSLAILRTLGDDRSVGVAVGLLGAIAAGRLDYERARQFHQESVDAARRLGDPIVTAVGLSNLGEVSMHLGDLDHAMAQQREALELAEQIGSRRHAALVHLQIGLIYQLEGDVGAAVRELTDGIAVLWELRALSYLTGPLEKLAELVTACGDPIQAARFLGAATALRTSLGEQAPPMIEQERAQAIEVTRAAASDEAFAAAFAEGEAAPLEAIIGEIEQARALADGTAVDPVDREVAERTGLTFQEVAVLRRFAAGRSNAEIAEELSVSLPIATALVGHLYTKLRADSRAALVAIAFKHGLV